MLILAIFGGLLIIMLIKQIFHSQRFPKVICGGNEYLIKRYLAVIIKFRLFRLSSLFPLACYLIQVGNLKVKLL